MTRAFWTAEVCPVAWTCAVLGARLVDPPEPESPATECVEPLVAGVRMAAVFVLPVEERSSLSWSEGFDPLSSPSLSPSSRIDGFTTSRSSWVVVTAFAGLADVGWVAMVAGSGAATVAAIDEEVRAPAFTVTTVGICETGGSTTALATAKPTAPTRRAAASTAAVRMIRRFKCPRPSARAARCDAMLASCAANAVPARERGCGTCSTPPGSRSDGTWRTGDSCTSARPRTGA